MITYKTECLEAGITTVEEFYEGHPYLIHRPKPAMRSPVRAMWVVMQDGKEVQRFPYVGLKEKDEAYERAEKYLLRHYFVEQLVKSPFGAYGEKKFVKERLEEIGVEIKQLFRYGVY